MPILARSSRKIAFTPRHVKACVIRLLHGFRKEEHFVSPPGIIYKQEAVQVTKRRLNCDNTGTMPKQRMMPPQSRAQLVNKATSGRAESADREEPNDLSKMQSLLLVFVGKSTSGQLVAADAVRRHAGRKVASLRRLKHKNADRLALPSTCGLVIGKDQEWPDEKKSAAKFSRQNRRTTDQDHEQQNPVHRRIPKVISSCRKAQPPTRAKSVCSGCLTRFSAEWCGP